MARRKAIGGNVLDAVAGTEEKAPAPAASKTPKERKPAVTQYTERQTYHMDPELVQKIRGAAWWERITVTEVVNTAVRQYIERMEKKNGRPYEAVAEARKGRPVR